jgi:hypothetical protein
MINEKIAPNIFKEKKNRNAQTHSTGRETHREKAIKRQELNIKRN